MNRSQTGNSSMPNNDSSTNNSQAPLSDNWLNEAADWWSKALSDAGAGLRARLDAEARRTRPKRPRSEPDFTDFDRHFFTLAGPKLDTVIACEACAVACDLQSFGEAHAWVMHRARKHGATYLSEAALIALDIWISQELASIISELA